METDAVCTYENGVIEDLSSADGLKSALNKENEIIDNGTKTVAIFDGTVQDKPLVGDPANDPSAIENGGLVTSCESKGSIPSKKPEAEHAAHSIQSKPQKDRIHQKNGSTYSRPGGKPSLSQSLSFNSKGVLTSGIRKGIEGKPMKNDGKSSRVEGPDNASSLSNGSLASTMRSNHTVPQPFALATNRRASAGVHASEGNTSGVSNRRATLTSAPVARRSQSGKAISTGSTTSTQQSEVIKTQDQNLKSLKHGVSGKDEEDALSTTSSHTPRGLLSRRSSSAGFSFRCDERAEKRKEFFTKLEEKIQAKEVEKTNLQAQSKESHEAEIKQLRKSLTFKATPMPSFYQEPAPPKVDLKKIPTTRPRSPKLGRHKSSIAPLALAAATDTTPNNTKSCKGSRQGSMDQANPNPPSQNTENTSKKPVRRSLTKAPSQKSSNPKTKEVSKDPAKPNIPEPPQTQIEENGSKMKDNSKENKVKEEDNLTSIDGGLSAEDEDEGMLNLPDPAPETAIADEAATVKS
ncbi:hypothetical protein AMTRI_Chr03g149530 [Amborella trichopoda]